MLASKLLPTVAEYLATPAVLEALEMAPGAQRQLTFLAQGEYNINYLLIAEDRRLVVRVNIGTQIGKPGGQQIAYEAAALQLLGPHRVAPALYFLDDTLATLPYGLLVMEFLPGGPLRYDDPAQLAAAARALAQLHRVPAPTGSRFIRRRALADDLAEARGWLDAYLACDRVPQPLHGCFARILQHAEADAGRYAERFPAPFALVHTDVQAHNFIVSHQPAADSRRGADSLLPAAECRLVDWERPLIDDPTCDLAHFLIPTTTRWKCGYTFSPEEREHFLSAYCDARPDLEPADIRERLRLRRPFILLRALSWCASAWVEYTGAGRAIANADTLRTIEAYLQPDELAALFPEWLGQG
jgi:aminoglycoside phosphotransferase (APT) family kinase protein